MFHFTAINTTGFDKLLLGSERITDVMQPSPPTANLANRVNTVKSLCVYNYSCDCWHGLADLTEVNHKRWAQPNGNIKWKLHLCYLLPVSRNKVEVIGCTNWGTIFEMLEFEWIGKYEIFLNTDIAARSWGLSGCGYINVSELGWRKLQGQLKY